MKGLYQGFKNFLSGKKPEFHSQTTDYTCGACSLIMGLNHLGIKKYTLGSTEDEMVIWENANTKFMCGEGPPGCSSFGLGKVAIECGLKAHIVDYFSHVLMADDLASDQIKNMTDKIKSDEKSFINQGGTVEYSRDYSAALDSCLENGGCAVILVSEFEEGGLHWVLAKKIANDSKDVLVCDPWSRRRTDKTKEQLIPLPVLKRLIPHKSLGFCSMLLLNK